MLVRWQVWFPVLCGLSMLYFFASDRTQLLQKSNTLVPCTSNTSSLETHVGAEQGQQAKEAVQENLTRKGKRRSKIAGGIKSTLPSNVEWMPVMEADRLFKRVRLERVSAREVVSGFWATAEKERLLTRLHYATPLAWLHIPKTGTSMAELILHSPTLCPGFPKDYHLRSGGIHRDEQLTVLEMFLRPHYRSKQFCNDSVVLPTLFRH
eukprot:4221429-Amphidinium_carterae.1